MAPITDDAISGLKGLITSLEARVHELEGKLASANGGEAPQGMRMTIMGPPGAGEETRKSSREERMLMRPV